MNYTEVDFSVTPLEPWRDILVAELGEVGYDTFEETENGVKAYIRSDRFDRAVLEGVIAAQFDGTQIAFEVKEIAPRNWNAEWEGSFQPVEVGNDVRIRAEFHASVTGFSHEIVITPRMAFGTGHHATTRMMVRAMLGLDLKERSVCDLGCGTAVLAILAEKLGASSVRGIDIDQLAVDNAKENVTLNGCQRITVEKGTAMQLEGHAYGAILANIERNTLIRDMRAMCDALLPGGALLLSGFVNEDREIMARAVQAVDLTLAEHISEGEWCLLGCRK